MKFSFLLLFIGASASAQKQMQLKPNQKIAKHNTNHRQLKKISGARKLQEDPSIKKTKLRGSDLPSKPYSKSQNAAALIGEKNLTAVIHIGPMKTGSSAIQSSLGIMYNSLKNLDNYEDAGFAMGKGIATFHMIGCFRPDADPYTGGPNFEISCHPNALKEASKIAERNHNLIITAEYLTNPRTDLVKFKEFLKPWKNRRIVAYYRRYYDWLLSFHNQLYKNHETPLTRKTLPDFLLNEMKFNHFYNAMYLTKAIERYQAEGFDDIKVINIYDLPNHDVRESFYCTGLVNATNTCTKFREYVKTETPGVVNPSMSLVYHELAYYAKEMNLWYDEDEKSLDVKSASKLAKEYHDQKRELQNTTHLHEFHDSDAFICPTPDVYKWLLETSLSIEKELFPEYYSKKGANEIIEHFNELVETKKFCHIDAQHILRNDEGWRTFFQVFLPDMTSF